MRRGPLPCVIVWVDDRVCCGVSGGEGDTPREVGVMDKIQAVIVFPSGLRFLRAWPSRGIGDKKSRYDISQDARVF